MTSTVTEHPSPVTCEAEANADFASQIRYAQCWEDADVLLDGLEVREGDTCLSIASAGDNALSLLTRKPARVIAVDLNPAQLACVALRVAAYRRLDHAGLLKLVGSTECDDAERADLYRRCRGELDASTQAFWDARPEAVAAGIGSAGKFERYFAAFRRWVLPLVHRRGTVETLLAPKPLEDRRTSYAERWDTLRWRLLFRVFFSRVVMGRLGRDPAMFRYVEGSVSERILARARHALAELEPSANPYLQWILLGRHGGALPHALRPEHFDLIRWHLDRLELRRSSVEACLAEAGLASIDRFNLSDIFEYMSADNCRQLLTSICRAGRPGGRLLYWNMLVPRCRPNDLADRLLPLDDLAAQLHLADKAFFYSRLVIEELR